MESNVKETCINQRVASIIERSAFNFRFHVFPEGWSWLLLLFSHPVMYNSLLPHGLQHARLPCPLPCPRVCPSSCPLHQWCHPAMSSSDTIFSYCPQSFPAFGTFPMSCLVVSDDWTIGAWALASVSVLPTNIQGWFPLGLISLSPCCSRDSQESSPSPQFESISSSALSFLYGPTLASIHDYWKNYSSDYTEPVCCSVSGLTVVSWSVYRFLRRRKVRWSAILISLRIIQVYFDPHSQRL